MDRINRYSRPSFGIISSRKVVTSISEDFGLCDFTTIAISFRMRFTRPEKPQVMLGWKVESTRASKMHWFGMWQIWTLICHPPGALSWVAVIRDFHYSLEYRSMMTLSSPFLQHFSLPLSVLLSITYRWKSVPVARCRLQSSSSRLRGTTFDSACAQCKLCFHSSFISSERLRVSFFGENGHSLRTLLPSLSSSTGGCQLKRHWIQPWLHLLFCCLCWSSPNRCDAHVTFSELHFLCRRRRKTN